MKTNTTIVRKAKTNGETSLNIKEPSKYIYYLDNLLTKAIKSDKYRQYMLSNRAHKYLTAAAQGEVRNYYS